MKKTIMTLAAFAAIAASGCQARVTERERVVRPGPAVQERVIVRPAPVVRERAVINVR